jgi:hypothetical protein
MRAEPFHTSPPAVYAPHALFRLCVCVWLRLSAPRRSCVHEAERVAACPRVV